MRDVCISLTALFGRIFLCAIFLFAAAGKLADWSGTTQYMAQKGMVATSLFLAGAIVLEVFGGLSVLFGFLTRYGAAALVLFLVVATPIFHDFWVEQGMAQVNQMQHFMKNVAIIGGALTVAAFGPGRYSVDHWRSRSRGQRGTRGEKHAEPVATA